MSSSDSVTSNVSVTMTLAALRKNVDRMKSLVSSATKPVARNARAPNPTLCKVPRLLINTRELFRFAKSSEDVHVSLQKEIDAVKLEHQRNLTMSRELANMKDVLYASNAKYGIDVILTEISQLESEQSVLDTMLSGLSGSSAYSSENFGTDLVDKLYEEKLAHDASKKDRYTSLNSDDYRYPNIRLFDEEELGTRIRDIKRTVAVLEQKRDEHNHSKKVVVKLSQATLELLGISVDQA